MKKTLKKSLFYQLKCSSPLEVWWGRGWRGIKTKRGLRNIRGIVENVGGNSFRRAFICIYLLDEISSKSVPTAQKPTLSRFFQWKKFFCGNLSCTTWVPTAIISGSTTHPNATLCEGTSRIDTCETVLAFSYGHPAISWNVDATEALSMPQDAMQHVIEVFQVSFENSHPLRSYDGLDNYRGPENYQHH